jgi:hypothetical protein
MTSALSSRPSRRVQAQASSSSASRSGAGGAGDRHRSPAPRRTTVRQIHSVLSGALARAVRWGRLGVNSAEHATAPAAPPPKPRPAHGRGCHPHRDRGMAGSRLGHARMARHGRPHLQESVTWVRDGTPAADLRAALWGERHRHLDTECPCQPIQHRLAVRNTVYPGSSPGSASRHPPWSIAGGSGCPAAPHKGGPPGSTPGPATGLRSRGPSCHCRTRSGSSSSVKLGEVPWCGQPAWT